MSVQVIEELAAKLGIEVDGASFAAAEKVLGAVRGGLVAAAAAGAAVGMAVLGAAVKTAAYADEVEKASQRTGIAVESLQALQYAAERADVGAGELQGALNFMAKRGVRDFEGELRRAADELAAMPDGAGKAARAMELFGKNGAQLIPMLNEGAAGLDHWMERARLMGRVLDKETIENGAKLKDAIEDVQGVLGGLAFTIAGPLLGPMRKFVDRIVEWFLANRKVIAQRIDRVVTAIGTAFKYAFQLAEPWLRLLWAVASNTWVLRGAMIALSLAMLHGLGKAALSTASSIAGLIKGVLGLAAAGASAAVMPILLGAALFALALVAEDIYRFLQGQDSLIGTLGMKYTKWLDEILAEDPSDSPLLKGLKAIGRAIFDIQGSLQKLDAWLNGNSTVANLLGGTLSGVNAVAYSVAAPFSDDAARKSNAHQRSAGYYFGKEFLTDQGREATGWNEAFTPGVPRVPAAAPSVSQSLNIEKIEVHAADGTDAGFKIQETLERIWSGKMFAAGAAALGPGK